MSGTGRLAALAALALLTTGIPGPARGLDEAIPAAPMTEPAVKAGEGSTAGAAAPEAAPPRAAPPPRARGGREFDAAGPETAQALRVVVGLTVIAILPALLISMTAFLRIVIVLSMLRHAIGMTQTPPNSALIGIALFLTLFTMSPVLQRVNEEAVRPFMASKLSAEAGYEKGMAPLREFMVRQTREQDLALMVELSKAAPPRSMDDVSNVQLIPAFMLSELRAAFQIGFVVFLPFLLIDLVVSSILMALGMMMMPPTTISLPLKILMFVLVDGWSLLLKALVGSFS